MSAEITQDDLDTLRAIRDANSENEIDIIAAYREQIEQSWRITCNEATRTHEREMAGMRDELAALRRRVSMLESGETHKRLEQALSEWCARALKAEAKLLAIKNAIGDTL